MYTIHEKPIILASRSRERFLLVDWDGKDFKTIQVNDYETAISLAEQEAPKNGV